MKDYVVNRHWYSNGTEKKMAVAIGNDYGARGGSWTTKQLTREEVMFLADHGLICHPGGSFSYYLYSYKVYHEPDSDESLGNRVIDAALKRHYLDKEQGKS